MIENDPDIFDFEKAYNESFKSIEENSIVKAKVLDISNDIVFLDFGYKSEGKVPTAEFEKLPKVGDEVDIFVIWLEGRNGEPVVSKKRCDSMIHRNELIKLWKERSLVTGIVREIRNNGVIVEYKEIKGFIPFSLFDIERREKFDEFLNKEIQFYLERLDLKDIFQQQNKQDRRDEEFVGNRKKYIYERNNNVKNDFFDQREKGEIVEGVVTGFTNFGAFIDLGGVSALLRLKDASWVRIINLNDILKKDQKIKVVILNIDKDKKKISVGLKQLQEDPWDKFINNYKVDDVIVGQVVSITTYGVFVKVIDGVEGLLHISDMSWVKKVKNPSELISNGQNLELKIIKIDRENRKVSLSLKHLLENPWQKVSEKYKIGTKVKGKIKNITTFGAFIELEEGIDALIHIDDVSWTESIRDPHKYFKIGDEIEAVVIQSDSKNEKIKISIKDLNSDPWKSVFDKYKNGDIISCIIEKIDEESGIAVKITDDISTFIPLSNIGFGKRQEIKSAINHEFKIGDEVKAVIINMDKDRRKIILSIKEYLKKNERDKVEAFLHNADEDSKYTLMDARKI